jgi:hypothetical protein
VASPYDEALADALGDTGESTELVERLRAGKADASDRLAAREQLDDEARHRFELAHPSPPPETAVELELGEVDVADLEKKLEELAAEHDGRELLVRLAVRVEPEE